MSDPESRRNAIRRSVRPREIDLGGLAVRRALPAAGLHAVGPWVFLDHMGPAWLPPGKGLDVKPHPHVNLATVTYLFEGQIVHRDSLGSVQTITPGAVNLMVAGRGIVHSERTGPELRAAGHRVNGLQLWFALPEEHEEAEPSFTHYPAEDLPRESLQGVEVRVMIGSAFALESPVRTFSPTLYAEAELPLGGRLRLPDGIGERAVYVVSGGLTAGDEQLPEQALILFEDRQDVTLSAAENSRIAIIGGAPLGPRHMWWNFVSSRMERIERAKDDWKADRMGRVPGETEAYPLPEHDRFSEQNQLG